MIFIYVCAMEFTNMITRSDRNVSLLQYIQGHTKALTSQNYMQSGECYFMSLHLNLIFPGYLTRPQ